MKKISIILLLLGAICYSQEKTTSFTTNKFECTLEYFRKTNEPEKFKAAIFLIKNMHIHKSEFYKWFFKNGNEFKFSEYEYEDYTKAYKHLFVLKNSIGISPKKITKYDLEQVDCDFLIKNINNAFTKWKSNPWSKSYSFDIFCEYILPYRSLIEPLENWRNDYEKLAFRKQYKLEDETDPIELCSYIISNLKDFTFINKRIDPNPLLSPQQMLFRKQGSCPDLANFAVLINRSVGIAVTFDYTPHYGASSNRHFWNTVIDKNGLHIPFNSNSLSEKNESLPYVYSANLKRLAKVFRKTFSVQESSLSYIRKGSKIPVGFLKQKNNLDVTNEYVDVADLVINTSRFNDTIAYINVFNHGSWRVVDWGKDEENKIVFKNLGRNIVYLPSTYKNYRTKFLEYPFLIDKKGEILELKPDFNNTFSPILSRDNEERLKYIDFNTLEIIESQEYALFYWRNGWELLGKSVATNLGVSFSNVPQNALFLLLPNEKDSFERIFTIDEESNKIFWY